MVWGKEWRSPCWGRGENGVQEGTGSSNRTLTLPLPISVQLPVSRISVGHTFRYSSFSKQACSHMSDSSCTARLIQPYFSVSEVIYHRLAIAQTCLRHVLVCFLHRSLAFDPRCQPSVRFLPYANIPLQLLIFRCVVLNNYSIRFFFLSIEVERRTKPGAKMSSTEVALCNNCFML